MGNTLAVAAAILITKLFQGALIMFAWNYCEVYTLFGLHEMNYAQGIAIAVISSIVFDHNGLKLGVKDNA